MEISILFIFKTYFKDSVYVAVKYSLKWFVGLRTLSLISILDQKHLQWDEKFSQMWQPCSFQQISFQPDFNSVVIQLLFNKLVARCNRNKLSAIISIVKENIFQFCTCGSFLSNQFSFPYSLLATKACPWGWFITGRVANHPSLPRTKGFLRT